MSRSRRGNVVCWARLLAAREHLGPDGRWVRLSRTTVDRWGPRVPCGRVRCARPAAAADAE